MARVRRHPESGRSGSDLLGIYVNDHLAGSTSGLELARRMAAAHRGTPMGGTLAPFVGEITEDRGALLDIMTKLGVPVRHYKVWSAWAAEKVTRLKFNGELLGRSPLSTLIELETLRLGVEGKAACWRTLRSLAERDGRFDAQRLDLLLERAHDQIETLEDLRVQTSNEVFMSAAP